MGGFHSLHTSRLHPDTFDYIGLFSPAIMPLEGSVPEIYKNMDAGLTTQNNKGYRLYWIAIGKDDFLYDQVSRYRGTLKRLGLPFTYTETEGGHRSEERRVGKECRSRRWAQHEKKKNER